MKFKFFGISWHSVGPTKSAVECSAENRRAALGPALFKIRFPIISMEQFSTTIVPSGVLTLEDTVSVYQFRHVNPYLRPPPVGLYELKFPTNGSEDSEKKN
ncbi:hypothetical protein niasHT_032667 [Heterodera trifolii]|uniref:Uncharacterized protein n=1 Tax=Heterodera trifolii TaxID=157864 RepID=A0ABD2IWH3_9BILA